MSEFLKHINEFIITAPTNKAKDVLVNKYNNYKTTPFEIASLKTPL